MTLCRHKQWLIPTVLLRMTKEISRALHDSAVGDVVSMSDIICCVDRVCMENIGSETEGAFK